MKMPSQGFPDEVSHEVRTEKFLITEVLERLALGLQFTGAEGRSTAMPMPADHDTRMVGTGPEARTRPCG